MVITPSTQTLIHRLAELGHLYSRIDSFIREREGATGVGMIEQSLCHHLQTQLTEYYRLIAVLETQMSLSRPNKNTSNTNADEESGLSLRRLDVWVNDWRLRLRMMSVCVEGARGCLISLSAIEANSCITVRLSWRRTSQPDTQLYRQW
jgi:gamma-tubulin complex component 3